MTRAMPAPDGIPSYLWLTRFYPYPPHAGDRIYSAKLIEALATLDCAVTVLCTTDAAAEAAAGGALPLPPDGLGRPVEWVRVPGNGPSRLWAYPVSRLPRQALALAGPAQQAAVKRLFRRQRWDAVLVDFVTMGWVLPLVTACWPDRATRPPLVYISHNHETSLRRTAAREATGSVPKRLAQRLDAGRCAVLEARLVAAAPLVTAITEADQALFHRDAPDRRCMVLPPGYDGPVAADRRLTADSPRRVVIVGSFDWIVKRQNLVEFLTAAAQPLAACGIGIDIVGRGPDSFLAGLRRRFPDVVLHGAVERVEPYLQGARISVVPERVGGGFKLKILDAVFQRVPVFALADSITGLPLTDGRSVRLCADFDELVRAITDAVDDLDGLNGLQREAFAACAGRFDWLDRGRALRAAIEGLAHGPVFRTGFGVQPDACGHCRDDADGRPRSGRFGP